MDKELLGYILGGILFVLFGLLMLMDITKRFTTIKNFSESNNYKLYFAGLICIGLGVYFLFNAFK